MSPPKGQIWLPALLLVLIVVLSLCSFLIAPYDPLHSVSGEELKAPSALHLLGTDLLGRDVLSRVLYGGRLTLTVAALAGVLAVLPGALLGLLSGMAGGWVDQVLGVLLDTLLTFPGLLVALCVAALLENGPLQVGIAVGLAGLAPYARVARAAIRAVNHQPYIESARAVGASSVHIALYHLLPNALAPLVAFATVILSWSILNAATLHFLGFGGDPSLPEWGKMLAEGRQTFRVAPWASLAPGAAITLTLFIVNWLADSLTRITQHR